MHRDDELFEKMYSVDGPTLDEVIEASKSDHLDLVVMAASHKLLPAEDIRRLVDLEPETDHEGEDGIIMESTILDIKMFAIRNPNAPLDVLEKVVADDLHGMKAAVAANPSAPAEMLLDLSFDTRGPVLMEVVKNPNRPVELLSEPRVVDNPSVAVRMALARQDATPEKVLLKLVQDEDSSVRRAAVSNFNLTGEVLGDVARGSDIEMIEALTCRSDLALDLFVYLASHESTVVLEALAQNIYAPSEVLRSLADRGLDKVDRNLAMNRNSPPDVLECLARHDDVVVRTFVAMSEDLDSDLLERLALDEELGVREWVAPNPNTPLHVLRFLFIDKELTVRTRVHQAFRQRVLNDSNSLYNF